MLVQPFKVGPFSFGNSTAVQSGKKIKPGAFGITTIWNDEAQTEEIRVFTRDIAKEMLSMEGFIGVSVFRIGGRGVTISAWEKPEHARNILRGGNHKQANPGELRAIGLDRRSVESLVNVRSNLDLEAELEKLKKLGVSVLTWDSSDYPDLLRNIADTGQGGCGDY